MVAAWPLLVVNLKTATCSHWLWCVQMSLSSATFKHSILLELLKHTYCLPASNLASFPQESIFDPRCISGCKTYWWLACQEGDIGDQVLRPCTRCLAKSISSVVVRSQ